MNATDITPGCTYIGKNTGLEYRVQLISPDGTVYFIIKAGLERGKCGKLSLADFADRMTQAQRTGSSAIRKGGLA